MSTITRVARKRGRSRGEGVEPQIEPELPRYGRRPKRGRYAAEPRAERQPFAEPRLPSRGPPSGIPSRRSTAARALLEEVYGPPAADLPLPPPLPPLRSVSELARELRAISRAALTLSEDARNLYDMLEQVNADVARLQLRA